jgi:hypothetical protein
MSLSDVAEDRINAVMRSEAAMARVVDRFIKPYEDYLGIAGCDGVSQVWDDAGDNLIGFRFPQGFQATRSRVDVGATQHEMGHFVTVSKNRAVRVAFGFGGGVPDLGFDPLSRTPVNPASANVEAKAIAWEYILMRDLHGLQPDVDHLASSLKYASDFDRYEGGTPEERIIWVANKVRGYIADFGDLAAFDAIWRTRCLELPELFARESIRANLYKGEPVLTERIEGIYDDWVAILKTYRQADVEETSVVLRQVDDVGEEFSAYEAFDTNTAARRWVQTVKEFYADVPAEELGAPGI